MHYSMTCEHTPCFPSVREDAKWKDVDLAVVSCCRYILIFGIIINNNNNTTNFI